jgi:diaminopimelate decarboxylase
MSHELKVDGAKVNNEDPGMTASSDWPPVMTEVEGRLVFDECDVAALARRFGTPIWVMSLPTIANNHRVFNEVWRGHYPKIECSYSLKANNTLAVIQTLAAEGAFFDCSGGAEFEIALRGGASADKCIFNGNGKGDDVLKGAATLGARQVNVDSIGEVRRLAAIADEVGALVDCVVRVQLGYVRLLALDPSFEPIVRIWEGKFGLNVGSGEAMRVIEEIGASPGLHFAGLHHHVGFSGVGDSYDPDRDVMHHRECVQELCEFAKDVEATTGWRVERLDLGGGFPCGDAMYLATPGNKGDGALHPLSPLDRYASVVSEVIRANFDADALPTLQFEAGRWHVGNAVVLLSAVTDVKEAHSVPPRRFVTVDSNMYQFTTKGFTNLAHQAFVCDRATAPAGHTLTDIVGQTCAYDSIVEDVYLPEDVAPGDVLLFTNQGAYCDSSGANFNAIPRPGTVAVESGHATLIKRPETLDDVIGRCVETPGEWTAV